MKHHALLRSCGLIGPEVVFYNGAERVEFWDAPTKSTTDRVGVLRERALLPYVTTIEKHCGRNAVRVDLAKADPNYVGDASNLVAAELLAMLRRLLEAVEDAGRPAGPWALTHVARDARDLVDAVKEGVLAGEL